jgi:nitrate/nitrite transporter NarK
VWGFSIENATYFAVLIQFTRPITVVLIGWIADQFLPSKVILPCFVCMAIASFSIGMGDFENSYFALSFCIFILMALATYSMRGLYFALLEEIKTPLQLTGTLVGIISVIGFTPDIFMSLFTGHILGENPGVSEYKQLFSLFTLFPIIGLIATLLFRKKTLEWK